MQSEMIYSPVLLTFLLKSRFLLKQIIDRMGCVSSSENESPKNPQGKKESKKNLPKKNEPQSQGEQFEKDETYQFLYGSSKPKPQYTSTQAKSHNVSEYNRGGVKTNSSNSYVYNPEIKKTSVEKPHEKVEGTFRNAQQQNIGKVEKDGTFRNDRFQNTGRIQKDGTIRNASFQKTGQFQRDGTFRNSRGQKSGRVESDGIVRAANGQKLGKIERDGTVRDSRGVRIGSSSGGTNATAYQYFFKK